MGKSLVIVESPAKVKTINKFLGKDFIVKSSVGHIRDLATRPSEPKAKSKKTDKDSAIAFKKIAQKLGVDPYNQWQAYYQILPGKEKVLAALKEAAEKVDTIYLATDLDREGEAIAWHLREAIGGAKDRYKRVTFTEITKSAIQKAFENPGTVNLDRVHAQQARRFLDRVVGFMLSPLLWQKVARGLSAGRVQSVAVRLIAEREREIHAFKPEEYWETHVDFKMAPPFKAQVSKFQGSAYRPQNQKQIDEHLKILKSQPYRIKTVEKKPTRSKPTAPFITSTLQQAASVRLNYGVKKTMVLAQQLYEAGLITYMRTDSTNLSKDAVESCRQYIEGKFGKKYMPPQPQEYTSKKSAQEAHEAIRPTDVGLSDTLTSGLDRDAQRLYEMIWRQFVACQMVPAEYDSTSVVIECNEYELRARGRILRFDGYLRVQPAVSSKGEEDLILPSLQEGANLTPVVVVPSQHFTKPPPRFTEASLVRELEKRGIGRPSTYASIISTIQERGYVRVEQRRFFCLKMGEIVTDRLKTSFEDLMDFGFTASMEEDLDEIASGSRDWKALLDEFFKNFTEKLKVAEERMAPNQATLTSIKCPKCARPMNFRTARTGVFLSCSGYSLPKDEKCDGTLNLVSGDQVEEYGNETSIGGEDEEGNVAEIQNRRRCGKCDTAMDSYLIDETRKIHICGNNPECDFYDLETGKFRIKGYEGPTVTCDKCGNQMQLKTGRFGKYFGCVAAPECKNTRKLLRNGEAAPPKADPIPMPELKCEKSDGYFVLRDGLSGLFLASSQFPKSRETRKPTVGDLKRHLKELPQKFHFLTQAPEVDPRGNPSLIRFSRKDARYTVMSEQAGKPTGWQMAWEDDRWKPI